MEVYKDNGIIDKLKSKVRNYREEDLSKNNYALYYKGYAMWTKECQAKYSTVEVEDKADSVGDMAAATVSATKTSIYIFVIHLLTAIATIVLTGFADKNLLITEIGAIIIFLLESTFYLYLFLVLYQSLHLSKYIDIVAFKDFSHLKCADDSMLQYAIDMFVRDFSRTNKLLWVAVGVAGASFVGGCLVFWYKT